MSYIRYEHRSLQNVQWLKVTPAGFVVHTWALDYCNEQLTDGRLPKVMARRLVCPVDPVDLEDAWTALLDAEVWLDEGEDYVCPLFEAYCLPAEEQSATREKWAADKRRQRMHRNGNHDLCTERSKCGFVHNNKVDMSTSSTGDKWTTRQDQTRPDQTRPLRGSGSGAGGQRADARSAGATRAPRVLDYADLLEDETRPADLSPWDVSVEANDYDDPSHAEVCVRPALDREFAEGWTEEQLEAGYAFVRTIVAGIVRKLAPIVGQARQTHKCAASHTKCGVSTEYLDDPEPMATLTVPRTLLDSWHVQAMEVCEDDLEAAYQEAS